MRLEDDKDTFANNCKWMPSGCIEWQGRQHPSGYGTSKVGYRYGGSQYAHRLSYNLYKGDIPKDYLVLHTCDNRMCVRPEHLFLGTQKENVHDMYSKGRDGARKLTQEEHDQICELQGKESARDVAVKFGISWSHVYALWRGRYKLWK